MTHHKIPTHIPMNMSTNEKPAVQCNPQVLSDSICVNVSVSVFQNKWCGYVLGVSYYFFYYLVHV